MKTQPAKSNAPNSSTRCEHRFARGAQCRLPALNAETAFCHRHARLEEQAANANLAATLTGGLDKLNSPAAINNFLSRLLLLLAQNRIAPRRAAVLAYITNQILRTVSAMEQQAVAARNPKNRPVRIIWGIPGPESERTNEPSHP